MDVRESGGLEQAKNTEVASQDDAKEQAQPDEVQRLEHRPRKWMSKLEPADSRAPKYLRGDCARGGFARREDLGMADPATDVRGAGQERHGDHRQEQNGGGIPAARRLGLPRLPQAKPRDHPSRFHEDQRKQRGTLVVVDQLGRYAWASFQ